MLAIDQQMREMFQTPGVRSVCLVDWRHGRALDCVGGDETDGVTATVAILRAVHGGPLRSGRSLEDVVVTEGDHHLLFAVLRGSELCVQVRVDRGRGDLAFVLRRLRELVGAAGAPLFGWLAERTSARTALVACVTGLTISAALVWNAQSLWGLRAWAVFHGLVNSGVVALRIDATAESIVCSPHEMKKMGMARLVGPRIPKMPQVFQSRGHCTP